MSERVRPPLKTPCGSCPYRKDVPSGVWHSEEYDKLPDFDKETSEQPTAVFLCHQQNGHLCGGWTAVHDMSQSMGLRIAFGLGMIDPADADAIFDYTTTTPLWSSGEEAAAHGKADIAEPSDKAQRIVGKLLKKPGVSAR